MNLEQVKVYLEENKENEDVKVYLGTLQKDVKVDLDVIKNKINEDEDVKSFIDSIKDTHFNKALGTWKENNLSKMIDEEVRKRFPEKDEKDVALQALEAKVEAMEREKTYEKLKNIALIEATEKGLPVELVDYFIGNDEEATKLNLGILQDTFNSKLEESVKLRLKDTSYVPPKSGDKAKYTKEEFSNMSYTEKTNLYNEDPELYKSLTK